MRKIRAGHEDLSPRVEVPDGVVAITVRPALDLFAKDVEILVDGQRVVGFVGRHEVGHRTGRNTQSAADCQSAKKKKNQRN